MTALPKGKKLLLKGLATAGLCSDCLDVIRGEDVTFIEDLCPACADIITRVKKEMSESGHYGREDN